MTNRTIKLHVDEALARRLEARASQLGVDLDEAATRALDVALSAPAPNGSPRS